MIQDAKYLLVGGAFGFALEKSKVYIPAVIIQQMAMENFVMMQVFLTATVTGMAFMSISEYLKIFTRTPKPHLSLSCHNPLLSSSNVIGGILIGSGMAISGACPGTVFVQLGTGVSGVGWTLLGAFLGSTTYGYFHRALKDSVNCFGDAKEAGRIDRGGKHYIMMAGAAAAVTTAGLYALNHVRPWQADFSDIVKGGDAVSMMDPLAFAWAPVTAGLAIGLVQLSSLIMTGSPIGASSVYPFIGSRISGMLDAAWEKNAPFFKSFWSKTETLAMATGMVLGGGMSAWLGGSWGSVVGSVGALRGVLGGFALVYGSRMAGGCTSGHGLSGMAQLSVASFVTVASMFGGGFLVYIPAFIVHQMAMRNFLMMQVFMTATVTGMAFMSITEYLHLFKRSPKPFVSLSCGNPLLSSSNIVGGFLIGAGMAISGACPGTIFVQLGAGVSSVGWTFLGTLLASISYGYFHRLLKSAVSCFDDVKQALVLDRGSGRNYLMVAGAASAVVTAGLIGLNHVKPWELDFEEVMGRDFVGGEVKGLVSTAFAWKPVTAGVGIGIVQLIALLLTRQPIGASSVYPFVGARIAKFLDGSWETNVPFFKSFVSKTETLAMAVGMVLGGGLSAVLGGSWGSVGAGADVGVVRALVGGFALVYGSRMAGGCTSGHGISGMAQLSLASFVTVASMFGGGFLVSLLLMV
ncbi:hypothetical protein HDU97_008443 [Phlyctochytrium planicorne]|nr:hypothetical protein HDU97_008443 [Phlyctochytrium planicorne]